MITDLTKMSATKLSRVLSERHQLHTDFFISEWLGYAFIISMKPEILFHKNIFNSKPPLDLTESIKDWYINKINELDSAKTQ